MSKSLDTKILKNTTFSRLLIMKENGREEFKHFSLPSLPFLSSAKLIGNIITIKISVFLLENNSLKVFVYI